MKAVATYRDRVIWECEVNETINFDNLPTCPKNKVIQKIDLKSMYITAMTKLYVGRNVK